MFRLLNQPNHYPETRNTEYGTRNAEHGTQNTEHRTRNTEHGTRNTEPFNLQPINLVNFTTIIYQLFCLQILDDILIKFTMIGLGCIFNRGIMP